jgi:hypothetical protein
MRRRTALPLVAALLAMTALAAPAGAKEDPPAPNAKNGKVDVSVKIDRFVSQSRRTVAHGTVTAELSDIQGNRSMVREPVSVEVRAAAGGCKILTLDLDELDLKLLGLNVHLDKVNLAVTGQKNGGVLGKLFCKLASSRVASRTAAAHAINARMNGKPMRLLSLKAPITQRVTSAQNGTPAPACQVLNLIVGPLNLELLGLVVDLNKVKLDITATRGAGALGDLFCQLADNNTSSGSSGG